MSDEGGYVPRKEISRLYHFAGDTEMEEMEKKKHKKKKKQQEEESSEEEAAFLHEETGKDRNYHATDDDVESALNVSSSAPAHSFLPHEQLTPGQRIFKNVKIAIIGATFFAFLIFFALQHSPDELPLNVLRGVSSASPLLVTLDPHHPLDTVKISAVLQAVANSTTEGDYPDPTEITFQMWGMEYRKENETVVDHWFPLYEPVVVEPDAEEMVPFTHFFHIHEEDAALPALRVNVSTNSARAIGMKFHAIQLSGLVRYQVLWGIIILCLVYVLIIFELVHRTLAALIGSFFGLTALALIQERPSFLEVVMWIDYNTIGLLFGMMVLVGIFSATGFFEWSAVKAYKLSRGNLWSLVVMLCLFTAFTSSFLDNVTTILLVAPVTLRLCRVIHLDPLPIVIAEVIFSNIGGTATGIGDPPNILIISAASIRRSKLADFTTFTAHMTPGVLVALVTTLYFLKWYRRDSLTNRDSKNTITKEIELWRKTANRMRPVSEEEIVVQQKLIEYIKSLEDDVNNMPEQEDAIDISALEKKYIITDQALFMKSCLVIVGVVLLFFIHPFVHVINLSLPWIALLGSVLLLTISGIEDVQGVIEKVEMLTLLFFAGLFVLMTCMEELEVMEYIAEKTANFISMVPAGDGRLAFAVVLLMWVCAVVSALIDNIPFTQTMIPIVVRLAQSGLGLPLQPLIWALAYGACLGGNATLIGASANVVAAGISEQQGYHISFIYFFKMGAPCMVVSLLTATVYLLLTHVWPLQWFSG